MTIAAWANNEQWNELTECNSNVEWKRMDSAADCNYPVDAFFLLQESSGFDWGNCTKPVFVHSVDISLKEINPTASAIRINGWRNFLQSNHWEIAGELTDAAASILATLQKQFAQVPDEPGFISARIIAMIINEAYFALGENVSTKDEIDIAMKLGTNYPYGPFEWAKIIGVKNIYSLLKKLSTADTRYLPAPLLQKEAIA